MITSPSGSSPTSFSSSLILHNLFRILVAPNTDEGTHIVRRGENLSIIAAEWGVSVTAILEANNISRRKLIRPGQRLVIPTFDTRKSIQEAERPSTGKPKS